MSGVDWQLLIGYEWADAQQYLDEEGVAYRLIHTRPPKKPNKEQDKDVRVIAVRTNEDPLQVICAPMDWTIS